MTQKPASVQNTSMRMILGRRRVQGSGALGLAVGIVAVLALFIAAQRAEAAVSEGQAEAAAVAGAAWFESEQEGSGALSGDWGMTALAAAGTNAADVRTNVIDPSAQDFYVGEWATKGPGGVATDSERAVLAGSAGGIQTSRVSATRNSVAQIAGFWDGTQVGATGLLNDDIFGVLALDRVGAPAPMLKEIADYIRTKQRPDGGWSWSNSPGATSDTDMTGSVLGALCETGADPQTDPAIRSAFGFLHSVQDEATGGFSAPPWTPVNSDSTGWVASGLIQCGVDPQSLEWTTGAGKTPFDFLLDMQKADGRFCWADVTTCEGSAAYATWDAVRPLAGDTWSAEAPEREVSGEPAIRPAPSVADGTEVPIALVINYGNGESDMCRIRVPSGSDLGTTIAAAKTTADPNGCVTGGDVSSGSGGEALEQLNGVAPAAGSKWMVKVDNGPETATTKTPIGFGDLVSLRLDGPAVAPIKTPDLKPRDRGNGTGTKPDPRKVKLGSADRVKLRTDQIKPRVTCPAGLGSEGCVGTVTIRYREGGKAHTGGQAAFALTSGASKRIGVKVRPGLRGAVAETGRRDVSLVAMTRSSDGSATFTHDSLLLIAPPSRGR